MKLSDQEIIDAYSVLRSEGHPDPLGFIARGEILTGLNPDRKAGNFQGPFGLNISKAKAFFYSDEEIKNKDSQLNIGVLLDISAYTDADKDLEGMYRLNLAKGKNAFNSFYKRLQRKKEQYKEQFKVDASGNISKIETKRESLDSGEQVVTSQDNRQAVEGTDAKDYDEFSARPRVRYETPEQIELDLRALIRIIMLEVRA